MYGMPLATSRAWGITSAQVAMQDIMRMHVGHAFSNLKGCAQNDVQCRFCVLVTAVTRPTLLQEDPSCHSVLQ